MKRHPLCALFPAMPPSELQALADDIKKHGQKHPVITYQGMLLDGQNRDAACQLLGIKAKEIEYRGTDPASIVISENLRQRDLTASQRAMLEVQIREWVPQGANKSRGAPGATLAEMAKESKTSERTIEQAMQVEKNGADELKAAVKSGEISVKKAAEVAKKPKARQPKALKEAKAPKPKKEKAAFDPAKCPNRDTCEVVQELAEVREKLDDAVDMLKTEDAILGTQPAIEMQKLRETLKQVTRRRDELMAQSVEMRREIGYWKGAAKKLGWKSGGTKK